MSTLGYGDIVPLTIEGARVSDSAGDLRANTIWTISERSRQRAQNSGVPQRRVESIQEKRPQNPKVSRRASVREET